ncbi:unknown [Prevotella sp. CAG:755]|nr:unknown [Prevotella sp. CAG:755]
MFESEHRTGDEGLTELVSEIRRAVRRFDKDLFWCLIEPLAGRHGALPRTPAVKARISRHVDSRSGYRPRPDTASHTVADFSARSGRSSIERLDSCREIVSLCFQRNDALNIFHDEVIACRMVFRGELLDDGPLRESHIVLIGRYDVMRVLARRFLDQGKQRRGTLLAIDDEDAPENLMPTVFGIDLCEAEHFGVCQFPAKLLLHLVEIVDFCRRERKPLLFVIRLQIVDMANRGRLNVHRENLLIQTVIHPLQHGIVVGVRARHGKVFLNTADTAEVHVLRDFNGICAPRCNHLATRTYVPTDEMVGGLNNSVAQQPAQGFHVGFRRLSFCLNRNNGFRGSRKKQNHNVRIFDYIYCIAAKLHFFAERSADRTQKSIHPHSGGLMSLPHFWGRIPHFQRQFHIDASNTQ